MTPSPQCVHARAVLCSPLGDPRPVAHQAPLSADTVMGAETRPGPGGGGRGNGGGWSQSSWGPQGLWADILALKQASGLL